VGEKNLRDGAATLTQAEIDLAVEVFKRLRQWKRDLKQKRVVRMAKGS